jgi:hypothetical protein
VKELAQPPFISFETVSRVEVFICKQVGMFFKMFDALELNTAFAAGGGQHNYPCIGISLDCFS